MKKAAFIFSLGILLVVGFYFAFNKQNKIKSPLGWEADFFVEDTSKLSKVFLVDANGNRVLLERSGKDWLLDGEYKASSSSINMLLGTLAKLRVRTPVAKKSKENILRKLAASHVKVELYNYSNHWSKVIYVGGPTPSHDGTYMVLEHPDYGRAEKPYIVDIDGFRGFATPRFHIITNEWRDKSIINLAEKDIEWIKLINHGDLKESFEVRSIETDKNLNWELLNNDTQKVAEMDTMAVRNFLTNFSNLNCEKILDSNISDYLKDLKFEIIVKSKEEKAPVYIKIYPNRDADGNINSNNYLGVIGESFHVTMQHFVLQNILIEKSNLTILTRY